MTRVDKQLQKLEQEIEAIRAAFAQNASSMTIYTTAITFTTSRNTTNWSNSGSYNPLQWASLISMYKTSGGDRFDTETIEVTFSCDAGINTFANLEIGFVTITSGLAVVSSRRIPHSGGARWLVTVRANATTDGSGFDVWQPSTLRFAVQSAVQGNLTARMIWQ